MTVQGIEAKVGFLLGLLAQFPRLICPRTLSPTAPGGPMAACACCFAIGGGLHHSPADWPLSICVTRPNRVRFRYGSRVRSAGLRHRRSLRGPPASLPVERAIIRATSFHVARPTSLILAHQRRKGAERPFHGLRVSAVHGGLPRKYSHTRRNAATV